MDDECCGAWQDVLKAAWPDIHVRLDAMRAIRRLTQTATSTQHPWRGQFCRMLSEAIFTDDEEALKRLRSACKQAGLRNSLPKQKYVPRVIVDPPRIIKFIGAGLSRLREHVHADA